MSHQITLDTEALYDARLRTLMGSGSAWDWKDAAVWAKAIADRKLALASLKNYASAVRFGARRALGEAAEVFVVAFNAALKPTQEAARSTGQRSRPKHRRMAISEATVRLLRKAAEWREENSRSTRATFVMDLAEGTLRFGLRPSEWGKASLVAESLVVKNGKRIVAELPHGPFAGRRYERGNGPRRELLVHSDFLSAHAPILRRISAAGPLSYRTNERGIRRAWREVVDTAVKRFGLPSRFRHLRLYDFRHQFAANWKKAVPASSGIVAALMGHASVRTAVQSYARVANGRGAGWGLRPSAESLEAVVTMEMWSGYPSSAPDKPAPSTPSAPTREPGAGRQNNSAARKTASIQHNRSSGRSRS